MEILQQPNTTMQGRMRLMRVRLVPGDNGVANELAVLPAGTLLQALYADVEETFDDGTSDELIVGTDADDDAYAKAVDVDLGTAGLTTAFTGDDAMPQILAADTTITAQYDGGAGDATQGKVTVTIVYGTCGI